MFLSLPKFFYKSHAKAPNYFFINIIDMQKFIKTVSVFM